LFSGHTTVPFQVRCPALPAARRHPPDQRHGGPFEALVRTHASLLGAPGSQTAGGASKASAAYPGMVEVRGGPATAPVEEAMPSGLTAAIQEYFGEEGLRAA
jgi:hypothetical protein